MMYGIPDEAAAEMIIFSTSLLRPLLRLTALISLNLQATLQVLNI